MAGILECMYEVKGKKFEGDHTHYSLVTHHTNYYLCSHL